MKEPWVLAAVDGEFDLSVGIHDVDTGNIHVSVLAGGTEVILSGATVAAVSGVALHECAVHLLHEGSDERRGELI